jgi:hypothetical protein
VIDDDDGSPDDSESLFSFNLGYVLSVVIYKYYLIILFSLVLCSSPNSKFGSGNFLNDLSRMNRSTQSDGKGTIAHACLRRVVHKVLSIIN